MVATEGKEGLRVDGLSVSFGGIRALDAVSFQWHIGILGVIGANGAGKTTLVNCITGCQKPTSGQMYLDGRRVTRLQAGQLARLGVARSFQHPRLLGACTVSENLILGPSRSRLLKSWHHLRKSTALGEILDPWADSEITALPYGVRKVLDVGRAAVGASRLLVCDEPLSGLDEESRDIMIGVLGSLARGGIQLLIVEHDVQRLLNLADRVVVMDRGTIASDCAPATLLADVALKRQYVDLR